MDSTTAFCFGTIIILIIALILWSVFRGFFFDGSKRKQDTISNNSSIENRSHSTLNNPYSSPINQPPTSRASSPHSQPPPIFRNQVPPHSRPTAPPNQTTQQIQPTIQPFLSSVNTVITRPVPKPPRISTQTANIFTVSSPKSLTNTPNIEDLHDALTGESLDLNRRLYQCNKCKVFYHAENYKILKEINSSECVVCQSVDIRPATKTSETSATSVFNPNAVTLENFKEYAGFVVIFEGYVVRVRESAKSPDNFAVMFENKGWVNGFKLVFFENSLAKFGGRNYVEGLEHKTVKVRGLIIQHETFGYEIVVSDKHMILEVN